MDETPSPGRARCARRRLLFRATHRGTSENDILLGGYVGRGSRLGARGSGGAGEILELPDPMLADWLTGRAKLPEGAPAMLRRVQGSA